MESITTPFLIDLISIMHKHLKKLMVFMRTKWWLFHTRWARRRCGVAHPYGQMTMNNYVGILYHFVKHGIPTVEIDPRCWC